MRHLPLLVCASLTMLSAACAGATGRTVTSQPTHGRGFPSRSPATATASAPAPGPTLRLLTRSRRATFVAGPRRGPDGLFAAYSIVKSISAAHNPGNSLTLLRWVGGRWAEDGRLSADHFHGLWDFPVNNLNADAVDGASSEAPVFDGREGGGDGYGLMVAVRQHDRWSWARFKGCPQPGHCPPLASESNTAANARIVNGRVIGELGNCDPSCATSTVVYDNEFSWVAADGVFVLTGQKQRARSPSSH